MKSQIVISGFGGQGTLLAGMVVAQSAIEAGLNTTWFPSYGAEMRGGTANSSVIVSDEEIGSPVVFSPDALIALNEQSLEKFGARLNSNGIVIAPFSDNNLRKDIDYNFIKVGEIAASLGQPKSINMVAVGALLAKLEKINKPFIKLENVFSACEKAFAKKPEFVEVNKKALSAGFEAAK
jgi:2-oxoglutarate ferredoxin oxidoreductase subunit gamma